MTTQQKIILTCEFCKNPKGEQITFRCENMLLIHIFTKKHIENYKSVNGASKLSKHLELYTKRHIEKKMKKKVVKKGDYFCKICNVEKGCQPYLDLHLKTNIHQKRMNTLNGKKIYRYSCLPCLFFTNIAATLRRHHTSIKHARKCGQP